MAITEVRVGYKRVVNLGNYESAAFEIGLVANSIDGGFLDPDTVARELWERCSYLVAEEAARRIPSPRQEVTTRMPAPPMAPPRPRPTL